MTQYKKNKLSREAAHEVFDKLWRYKGDEARTDSYKILTALLPTQGKQGTFATSSDDGCVHFSYMDSDQCLLAIAKLISLANNINIKEAKKIAKQYFQEFENNQDVRTPILESTSIKILQSRLQNGEFRSKQNAPLKPQIREASEIEFFVAQLKDFINLGGVSKLDQRHQDYWREIQKQTLEKFDGYEKKLKKDGKALIKDGEEIGDNKKLEAFRILEFAEYLYYQNRFTVFDLDYVSRQDEKSEEVKAVQEEVAQDEELTTASSQKPSSKSKQKTKKSRGKNENLDDVFAEFALENKGRISIDEILTLSQNAQSYLNLQETEFFRKIREHVESFSVDESKQKSDPSLIIALGEFMRIISLQTKDAGSTGLFNEFIEKILSRLEKPQSFGADFRKIAAKYVFLSKEKEGALFTKYCSKIICQALDLNFDAEQIKKLKTVFDKLDKNIFGSEEVFFNIVQNNPSLLQYEEIKSCFKAKSTDELEKQIEVIINNINPFTSREEDIGYLIEYVKELDVNFIRKNLNFESRAWLAYTVMVNSPENFSHIFGNPPTCLKNKEGSYYRIVLDGAIWTGNIELFRKLFSSISPEDKLSFVKSENEQKKTPIEKAAFVGFVDIFAEMLSWIPSLKEKQTLVTKASSEGNFPLIATTIRDNLGVAEQIVGLFPASSLQDQQAKFACLTQKNNNKDSAIIVGLNSRSSRVIKYILDQVLSLDKIDKDKKLEFLASTNKFGSNALIFACDKGFTDGVELILSAVNSLGVSDDKKIGFINNFFGGGDSGMNALDIAIERGHRDVVIKIMEFVPEAYRQTLADAAKLKVTDPDRLNELLNAGNQQDTPGTSPQNPILLKYFKEQSPYCQVKCSLM